MKLIWKISLVVVDIVLILSGQQMSKIRSEVLVGRGVGSESDLIRGAHYNLLWDIEGPVGRDS
jgi:hypothetical protein